MKRNNVKPATLAAQIGGKIDASSGGLVPPIQPSTTFVRGPDYALLNPDNIYARDNNDTVRLAEDILAKLEHADEALLFPSGMAATAALFRTLPNGSSVVLQSNIYWGTTKWVRDFCARREIALREVDAANLDELRTACEVAKPDIVMVETPSNPWLKSVDIRAASDCAKWSDALLVVDGTAASPVLTQALNHGANIVMHSATKAINGHSDVLAGVLAIDDGARPIWPAIKADRHDAGAIIGAFEAWLLLRGMRTMPLRVERMSQNALAIAEHLDCHPNVASVLYPGLPTNPSHRLAEKQMSGGFGSLLSFLVEGGAAEALQAVGKLTLFHRATSLGGVESLVEHRHTIEPDTGIPPNLLRLSVGIEDIEDLITDLDQALR